MSFATPTYDMALRLTVLINNREMALSFLRAAPPSTAVNAAIAVLTDEPVPGSPGGIARDATRVSRAAQLPPRRLPPPTLTQRPQPSSRTVDLTKRRRLRARTPARPPSSGLGATTVPAAFRG